MMEKISKDITIEDLIRILPDSVGYLMKKGIKCLACGEPIWGTLESASKQKGFNDSQIMDFVSDLNIMLNNYQTNIKEK